jgi:hypothetical protein
MKWSNISYFEIVLHGPQDVREAPQPNESKNCFVLVVQIFRVCLHAYVVVSCMTPNLLSKKTREICHFLWHTAFSAMLGYVEQVNRKALSLCQLISLKK